MQSTTAPSRPPSVATPPQHPLPDRWVVEHDPAFGGWIITTRAGELVAQFEVEREARQAADAVNAQIEPRRSAWEARR